MRKPIRHLMKRPAPQFAHMLVAVVLIALVTVYAFLPGLANEFVDWDDLQILVQNDRFRGFSLDHLAWMFTTGFGGHYQPLSWLTFAIDHTLWGEAAFGFHLTNLLLHVVAATVLLCVARRLIRAAMPDCAEAAVWLGAGLAAMLFAVHPLRVESVTWATERRDVLSGALLMATVLLYLRAVDGSQRRWAWLGVSLLAYVLSLLSKASGMTLPFVLLIIDVYPLRRFLKVRQRIALDGRADGSAVRVHDTPMEIEKRPPAPPGILLEKAVFLAPAIVVAIVAAWAQRSAGAMWTLDLHPLSLRIAQAFYGIVFYPFKTLWPFDLIPLYEQPPDAQATDPAYLLSAAIVLLVTLVAVWLRRRAPWFPACWFAYVLLVSPMLGLFQSGPQLVADRYSYLSCIPWAILMGGGLATALGRLTGVKRVVVALPALAVVVLCVGLTRAQTQIWRDSMTLWTHTIEVAPNTGIAHAHLASLYLQSGNLAKARQHGTQALDILPGNLAAHRAMGRIYSDLGEFERAAEHYRIAIEIRPGDPQLHTAYAFVLEQSGLMSEAQEQFRAAIAAEPGDYVYRYNLAAYFSRQQRLDESIALCRETLERERPAAEVYVLLATSLDAQERQAEAVQTLRDGLLHVADSRLLELRLAWMLATSIQSQIRDGAEARKLAEAVLAENPEDRLAAEVLAASLAELGEFQRAEEIVAELLTSISDTGGSYSARLQDQLDAYRSGRPIRE